MADEFRERCRRLVRQVLELREWQLVRDEEAFVTAVIVETQERRRRSSLPDDQLIEQATVNRYCHLWYTACRAREGSWERWRAYEELETEVERVAWFWLRPDEQATEEAIQATLTKIWRSIATFDEPGAFLYLVRRIANQQAQTVLRRLIRARQGNEVVVSDLVTRGAEGEEEADIGELTGMKADGPELGLDAFRQEIEAKIRGCLKNRRYRAVIIGLFLDDLDHFVMASILNVSLDQLRVVKHRAIEKLKQCLDFLEFVEGWL